MRGAARRARTEMAVLRRFAPTFEQAYFIHNFKGSTPAVLFRAYPGPWQLLLRARDGSLELVHEQEAFPGLRGVAVDILPRVLAARQKRGR